jgi:energy-coupling factor transport system permease protein
MGYLSSITFGRYVPTGSAVHRLDARTKLISFLAILSASVSGVSFIPVLGLFLFVFTVAGLARLRLGLLMSNLRPMAWLLGLTILLNAVLTPGRSHLFGFTEEGLRQGLFLALRLTGLVLTASLLTLTTSPLDLADGIERLLRPAKRLGVPAHELAMTLTIALRFVPTLADEAERLRRAQLSRGADLEGGLLRRVRGLTSLLVPLFLSAFRRADRLAVAMEARCYRGEEGRTSYARAGFRGTDVVAVVAVALVTAGMWCWK